MSNRNLTPLERNVCHALEGAALGASDEAVTEAQELFLTLAHRDWRAAERRALWWLGARDGLERLVAEAERLLREDRPELPSVTSEVMAFIARRLRFLENPA